MKAAKKVPLLELFKSLKTKEKEKNQMTTKREGSDP